MINNGRWQKQVTGELPDWFKVTDWWGRSNLHCIMESDCGGYFVFQFKPKKKTDKSFPIWLRVEKFEQVPYLATKRGCNFFRTRMKLSTVVSRRSPSTHSFIFMKTLHEDSWLIFPKLQSRTSAYFYLFFALAAGVRSLHRVAVTNGSLLVAITNLWKGRYYTAEAERPFCTRFTLKLDHQSICSLINPTTTKKTKTNLLSVLSQAPAPPPSALIRPLCVCAQTHVSVRVGVCVHVLKVVLGGPSLCRAFPLGPAGRAGETQAQTHKWSIADASSWGYRPRLMTPCTATLSLLRTSTLLK